MLFVHYADLNALDHDRYDVLTIAAVADDEAMVRLAIAAGADTGLVTSRYDGTALIAAAHLGHDGVVRALIEGGAPLDHVNNLHWTALIEAVTSSTIAVNPAASSSSRQATEPASFMMAAS